MLKECLCEELTCDLCDEVSGEEQFRPRYIWEKVINLSGFAKDLGTLIPMIWEDPQYQANLDGLPNGQRSIGI